LEDPYGHAEFHQLVTLPPAVTAHPEENDGGYDGLPEVIGELTRALKILVLTCNTNQFGF